LARTSKVRSEDCVVPPDEWAWIENIIGLCDPTEGEWLANRAAEVPSYHDIVEIGSHTGQSTCWLAAGSRQGNGAPVYAVDPWPDPGYAENDDPFDFKTGDAVFQRFKANIRGQGQGMWNVSYQDLINPWRMTSEQAASVWPERRHDDARTIGLLFIDAIHTFEGVKKDVDLWAQYIVPGGWLALNDYWLFPSREGLNGAALVAKEILEPSGEWEDCDVVWNTWVGRRVRQD
jgi:hypothetical protein